MRIRIIVLDGAPASHILDAGEVVIGRKGANGGGGNTILSLADREVSRRHARLWEERGKWYIADSNSKNGTFVEGEDIRGLEKKEIRPGALVEAGHTRMILTPADWFYISQETFIVYGKPSGAFSYAAHHCGRFLIDRLHVMNIGEKPTDAVELAVRLEGYGDVYVAAIPALDPGERIRVESMRPLFCLNAFSRFEKAAKTMLMVKIGDCGGYEAIGEATVLGFWDWLYEESYPESLAAYVFPRDPAVRGMVRNSEDILREISGYPGYGALIASGSGDTEILAMKALYSYFRDREDIVYEYPQLSFRGEPDISHQAIKHPGMIISGGTESAGANCLDLSLLFAACCESIGLYPLIFLTGTGDTPTHALAGCWAGASPGARPVIRSAGYVKDELASGNLIAVECTGFASNTGGREKKIGFCEAVDSGHEHLLAADWICTVDICAMRPPLGNILPMDSFSGSPLSEIHEAARALAVKKRRSLIETSFLLYGLLMNPGETAGLLAAERIDAAAVCRKFESLIPEGDSTIEPVWTNGYRECVYLAGEFAIEGKSGMIRERDLWRAVIRAGRLNRNLIRLCPLLGIDMARIEIALEEHFPRREKCDSVSFGSSFGMP